MSATVRTCNHMHLADGQVIDFSPIIWRLPSDPPPPRVPLLLALYEPGADEPLLEYGEARGSSREDPGWQLVGGEVSINAADVLRWAYPPRVPNVMPDEAEVAS